VPETGAEVLGRALPDVSRETCQRLEAYAALLAKWQRTINLVGPGTLPEMWTRHFLDSAQLYPLLPQVTRVLVDLGSGAGFPGLVLAILGVPEVHLVESDSRKAAFLREAARLAGAKVTVHPRRIEDIPHFTADAVTARALAPLDSLLGLAERFLGAGTLCLFPKGQNVDAELTEATKAWRMRIERLPSLSDPQATVLRLSEISRV